MKISGIVLAGGKSTRFNFNKLQIRIGRVPLFIDTIFKLSFFCDEIIITTSSENLNFIKSELKKVKKYFSKYQFDSLKKPIKKIIDSPLSNRNSRIKVIKDIERINGKKLTNTGSLIGIYTGLLNTNNFYSFVLAFDMPFISYKLIGIILNLNSIREIRNPDIVITKNVKGFEALCGLYSKNCIEIIEENLKNEVFKISDIFYSLKTKIFTMTELEKKGIDILNFFNINTLKDYLAFQKEWNRENEKFSEKWYKYFLRSCII